MFGRRRRPILGAAVVVGASRAAARHEVEKQTAVNAQREFEVQQQVELRRREEEEQERRTQRAVDEAMRKAAAENQASQQSEAAVNSPPPPQQYYNTQPPMPVQTQDMGLLTAMPGQPYTPVANAMPSIQPEQRMRVPSPQPPTYSTGSPLQQGRPRSAQGLVSLGPTPEQMIQFCTQCGFACQVGDRFCRQCGTKQVFQGGMTE
ncbi:hypothetical protein ACJZ2D_006931 [Fusarium nematophilum]